MAVALVLSAGGMFAAWEIGVWRALSRQFKPDMIVGASAGALNGWGIAAGVSPETLTREWLDPASAKILQKGMRPQALYETSRRIFADWQPKIPYGLTLTDLRRMRPALFRYPGIGWKHLAATASIPLFFPPVEIEGRYYVDGGLLGALPLWAAQQMGATRAIALNVWTYTYLAPAVRTRIPRSTIDTIRIEPSERLGSLRDAAVWSAPNIERWLALGERDGNRAAASITM